MRFFRLAERRIAEMTGKGVISFISNFSYLSDPSFVVMRQRFLSQFDKLWFDCMNGDSRETGKLTPDGKPDPSVFSTEYNREGIRVGTAVCVIVRNHAQTKPVVRFRNFWGATSGRSAGQPGSRASECRIHCVQSSARESSFLPSGKCGPRLTTSGQASCLFAGSNLLVAFRKCGALMDITHDDLSRRLFVL